MSLKCLINVHCCFLSHHPARKNSLADRFCLEYRFVLISRSPHEAQAPNRSLKLRFSTCTAQRVRGAGPTRAARSEARRSLLAAQDESGAPGDRPACGTGGPRPRPCAVAASGRFLTAFPGLSVSHEIKTKHRDDKVPSSESQRLLSEVCVPRGSGVRGRERGTLTGTACQGAGQVPPLLPDMSHTPKGVSSTSPATQTGNKSRERG